MRSAIGLVTAIVLGTSFGCSEPIEPTHSSSPRTDELLFPIGVFVVDDFGRCIEGGQVTVLNGQRAGRTFTQGWPCNMWSTDAAYIDSLDMGVEVRVRGSAPGYLSEEATTVPGPGPFTAIAIFLAPEP